MNTRRPDAVAAVEPSVTRERPRGWLLLLTRILMVWEPLLLALIYRLDLFLPSLNAEEWLEAVVALARIALAGAGVAAGLAIRNVQPHAVALARCVLVADGALNTVLLNTRLLSSNRMPQDDLLYTAALLAHHGAWLVYLQRSPQVRGLFRS